MQNLLNFDFKKNQNPYLEKYVHLFLILSKANLRTHTDTSSSPDIYFTVTTFLIWIQ